jgi:hypothetical protein
MTHEELLFGIKEIERLAEGMWGTKALRAVVELHKPFPEPENSPFKDSCFGCNKTYPCKTIKAIEKELA